MGNSLNMGARGKRHPLPIETVFRLPNPPPRWPPGGGFAEGSIDLGGLEVCQISSFTKIWATHEGGPDNLGATFFVPSPVPSGFSVLGCYAQPNNRPLFGWVLGGRDVTGGGALQRPVGYKLVWSSANSRIKRDGDGYFWLPTPPDGFRAVGLLVTSTPETPSPEEIRCVRADLAGECENDGWVWGDGSGFNVYGLRPAERGARAAGVRVGTCMAGPSTPYCLKNKAPVPSSSMPNRGQIEALVQAYSPWVSLHPDDPYLPSSVGWFFAHGALLYKKDDPARPSPVEPPAGANLPQGGSNDGAYWLDLPAGGGDEIKKGDLGSSEAYVHVKPMLGGTFTDVAVWVFYPFNGPARAKVEFVNIPFSRIGEHVGDWEHVTLRVSNLTGELWRVFFAQHGSGEWVDASRVEFRGGTNKPVAYASLHGHAAYPSPGLVLQGDAKLGVGIRDDTAGGGRGMDTGARYQLVAADHLGGAVAEPPWLNYFRQWGPTVSYDIAGELKKLERLLPRKLRERLENVVNSLPKEILGEEGPTGPKEKSNWAGDEVSRD